MTDVKRMKLTVLQPSMPLNTPANGAKIGSGNQTTDQSAPPKARSYMDIINNFMVLFPSKRPSKPKSEPEEESLVQKKDMVIQNESLSTTGPLGLGVVSDLEVEEKMEIDDMELEEALTPFKIEVKTPIKVKFETLNPPNLKTADQQSDNKDNKHSTLQLKSKKSIPEITMAYLKEWPIIKKNFFCEVCPKKFPTEHLLVEHLITHAFLSSWDCDKCEATFSRPMELHRHVIFNHDKHEPNMRRKKVNVDISKIKFEPLN